MPETTPLSVDDAPRGAAAVAPTVASADAGLTLTTRMSLRRLLHAYRDGWLPEQRLATSARLVADDARRQGLPAARMLVAVKAEWAALAEVRRVSMHEVRGPSELLERLVTLCIRAYYAAATGPAAPGGGEPGVDVRRRAGARSAA